MPTRILRKIAICEEYSREMRQWNENIVRIQNFGEFRFLRHFGEPLLETTFFLNWHPTHTSNDVLVSHIVCKATIMYSTPFGLATRSFFII